MAIFKRGRIWWTDFSVNGQRYRQSLHTKDWRKAQSEETKLIAQAESGRLTLSGQKFARLAFSIAAERYLSDGLTRWAPRTIQTERERSRPLVAYFNATEVTKISAESVRDFMAKRKACGISNRTINRERDFLRGVLKMAKRWQLIADEVRPLPGGENVGRALLAEEKLKLLKTAASKPEWQVARLAMILALNTTMRGCELRALRWRDIDFLERTVTVRRSKTEAGKRLIPLNANGWDAILELRERSKHLFGESLSPDWHLFPHAEGFSKPDPTQPMWRGGWRTAWRNISREAGLKGLRFHDLRHHAITELAESDASDQTIRSIAGHVSEKMLGHYSHIRLEAKRRALDALSGKRTEPSQGNVGGSYGTNDVTNPDSTPNSNPQVIEKIGGADGVRTRDLLDAIEARSQLRYGPTFLLGRIIL